jgi:predicted transcriptional regulator
VIVEEIVETLKATLAAGKNGGDRAAACGYCGDLLSEVMANAPEKCVWITVQTHQNIVAVAVLKEMAAIILSSGQEPDAETIAKANQEGIPILTSPEASFDLAVRLHQGGVPTRQELGG